LTLSLLINPLVVLRVGTGMTSPLAALLNNRDYQIFLSASLSLVGLPVVPVIFVFLLV
jgi:hypothetical protein